MTAEILIVEDEPAIRQIVAMTMSHEGFKTIEVDDVTGAVKSLATMVPDLIILDWMMPGLTGLEFTKRIKKSRRTKHIPIILLTAKSQEHDKVAALNSGADDYITKPFSAAELVARVKAVLRRVNVSSDREVLNVGNIKVDLRSRRAFCEGDKLNLSPLEFKLLEFFVSHPERVFTRTQLLDQVWGTNTFIEDRTVDVHIRRLRKVLSRHECSDYIQTVRGSGYLFTETVA
ncbi:MAG: phosphate regulon transcriptional regulator PhoB [Gammaproteobacteria bacterium]